MGRCGFECTPNGYVDDACPDNLKNCVAPAGEQAYCESAGDGAPGDSCPSILKANTCAPGSICTDDMTYLIGGNDQLEEPGLCSAYCDPFGDDSECRDGTVCALNFLFVDSLEVGTCMPEGANTAVTEAFGDCAEPNKACGQRGLCIEDTPGSNFCLNFCDPASNEAGNCPGDSVCLTSANGQDLSFGAYGRCLPAEFAQ